MNYSMEECCNKINNYYGTLGSAVGRRLLAFKRQALVLRIDKR